jgi:hypothetical protein
MNNSDFIKTITNEEFRWILTEQTQYLKPFPLPKTDTAIYTHQYIDADFHKGAGCKELATVLVLLIKNEYLTPIRFKNPLFTNPKGDGVPFFIFTNDIKDLPDDDWYSFDYFDMNEAAKVMEN